MRAVRAGRCNVDASDCEWSGDIVGEGADDTTRAISRPTANNRQHNLALAAFAVQDNYNIPALLHEFDFEYTETYVNQ